MASWKIEPITCVINMDASAVAMPSLGGSLRSYLRQVNHDYVSLPRISWKRAEEFLIEDEELMASFSAADEDAEFTLVDDSDEMRRGAADELSCIDIGIVSTVACLLALGAKTITSCNEGWDFSSHHEDHPLVIFFATPVALAAILKAAKEERVGLSNVEPSAAMIYAASIPPMIRLARRLFDDNSTNRKRKGPR